MNRKENKMKIKDGQRSFRKCGELYRSDQKEINFERRLRKKEIHNNGHSEKTLWFRPDELMVFLYRCAQHSYCVGDFEISSGLNRRLLNFDSKLEPIYPLTRDYREH